VSPARGEGPGLPSAGGATIRGAALVAVAVIVGVILLGKGFDTGFLPTSSETPSEQAANDDDDEEPTDDGEGTTTSTTAAAVAHDASQVRVIVLNGGGPSGSASTSSTALAAAGFPTLDAADTDDVAATVVFATPGFEADAAIVAQTLGIAAPAQAMPATPPTGTPVGQVDVVVVLGPDFTPVA
jgi:hypothetical protein